MLQKISYTQKNDAIPGKRSTASKSCLEGDALSHQTLSRYKEHGIAIIASLKAFLNYTIREYS
jgi:hypothetical protein